MGLGVLDHIWEGIHGSFKGKSYKSRNSEALEELASVGLGLRVDFLTRLGFRV